MSWIITIRDHLLSSLRRTKNVRICNTCDLRTLFCYIFILILCFSQLTVCLSQNIYLNKFAVHIEGGEEHAKQLAVKHGFTFLGQVGDLKDHYEFEHPHIHKRSTSHSHRHHQLLTEESSVKWFEQQKLLVRNKRDLFEQQELLVRNKRDLKWNDKLYPNMWYLHGGGKKKDEGSYDMQVQGAWNMGYTGKGIVITILDDGIERTHDDLRDNYDPYASCDVNSHDSDPMPRYDPSNENRHGTRCAGEVSAKGNNTACIVGVAYNSRIGGVRMLDGDVYDLVEAKSLSFNRSHIDIYSASWGPDDDGRVVDGPGILAKQAFIDGITQGRGGKGSIFVWASGNGGSASDSCNCDGYTNSIYTLSISSTSEHGTKPWYLEECSSTLATTYSSGAYHEKQVVTVDLHNKCTTSHTGTSASAPLAAGIVALVLEANPFLTWRDVQYITMRSANPEPMYDGNWIENGKGRKVSLRYGYGLMNATRMVEEALVWTNVPKQHICYINSTRKEVKLKRNGYSDTVISDSCSNTPHEVNYLEHVQAKIFLSYNIRGHVVIHLTSPSGTKSTLLPKRPNDYSDKGFNGWPFLSVHFWGENPAGSWKLEIEDAGPNIPKNSDANEQKGTLHAWFLVLHGTDTQPVNLKASSTKQPYVTKMTTVRHTATPPPYKCHNECLTSCSGPKAEECYDCKHVRMGDHGACVESCPATYKVVQGKCIKCEDNCDSCTTIFGYKLLCEKCKPNFYMLEGEGQCVTKCPDGYFPEHSQIKEKVCRKCERQCETCVDQADKCTTCPSGLLILNNKCTLPEKICPEGYFKDKTKCNQCDPGCKVCDGPSKCVQCQQDRLLFGGDCIKNCPDGYLTYTVYETRVSFNKKCVPCQKEVCGVCPKGFEWSVNSCVQKTPCERQTYFDWRSMKCQQCYRKCERCHGPGPDGCSTCKPPLMYHAYLRTCLPCCQKNEAEVTCCNCNPTQGKCIVKSMEPLNAGILSSYSVILVTVVIVIAVIILFLVIFIVYSLKSKPYSSRFQSEKLAPIRYEKLLQNDEDF